MGLPSDQPENKSSGGGEINMADDVTPAHFHDIVNEGITHQRTHDPHRRYSLPPGMLDHTNIRVLCGQILRIIGDEHHMKACGRKLRYIGDEITLSYGMRQWLTQMAIRSEIDRSRHEQSIPCTHSLPDLRKEDGDLEPGHVQNEANPPK